jgi:hypothetical protein
VHAAQKAAAELAPHVEAAQKALKDDVVPRLSAAQVAALSYAAPRVSAARDAVTPALESARETLAAGVDSARSELEARRAELVGQSAGARKKAAKQRKKAGKKRAKTAGKGRAPVAAATPRRWPWVLMALAVGAAAFTALRRRKADDLWNPAPSGDGPVPSYREDPVPSSPSNDGKTVSTAQTMPGDATPADSTIGEQPQQMAYGDESNQAAPAGTGTTQSGDPALDTATASPNDSAVPPDATGTENTDQPTNPA